MLFANSVMGAEGSTSPLMQEPQTASTASDLAEGLELNPKTLKQALRIYERGLTTITQEHTVPAEVRDLEKVVTDPTTLIHCSICIDTKSATDTTVLKCGHTFCSKCRVEQLQKGGVSCAFCRETPETTPQGYKLDRLFPLHDEPRSLEEIANQPVVIPVVEQEPEVDIINLMEIGIIEATENAIFSNELRTIWPQSPQQLPHFYADFVDYAVKNVLRRDEIRGATVRPVERQLTIRQAARQVAEAAINNMMNGGNENEIALNTAANRLTRIMQPIIAKASKQIVALDRFVPYQEGEVLTPAEMADLKRLLDLPERITSLDMCIDISGMIVNGIQKHYPHEIIRILEQFKTQAEEEVRIFQEEEIIRLAARERARIAAAAKNKKIGLWLTGTVLVAVILEDTGFAYKIVPALTTAATGLSQFVRSGIASTTGPILASFATRFSQFAGSSIVQKVVPVITSAATRVSQCTHSVVPVQFGLVYGVTMGAFSACGYFKDRWLHDETILRKYYDTKYKGTYSKFTSEFIEKERIKKSFIPALCAAGIVTGLNYFSK